MATASSPAAAASAGPRPSRAIRHAVGGGLVVVGVALALRVAYSPSHLNYDARYALLWARDVAPIDWPGVETGISIRIACVPAVAGRKTLPRLSV